MIRASEVRASQAAAARNRWRPKLDEIDDAIAVASANTKVTQITVEVSDSAVQTGSAHQLVQILHDNEYETKWLSSYNPLTQSFPLIISWRTR